MGTADIVPGVSGGTMALVLGIYKQFLEAIKSFDFQWVKACATLNYKEVLKRPHFNFIIPLGIGIACAIMFFTKVISLPSLLITNPEMIYGLFSGLVLGSAVILLKDIFSFPVYHGMALLSAGFSFGIFIMTIAPTSSPDSFTLLFIAGAVSVSAMIMPGISGSLVLLIVGKYTTVLNAISTFDWHILIPFFIGGITGVMTTSRMLSWMIDRHLLSFKLVMSGFLTSSLYKLWPFQDRQYFASEGVLKTLSSTPHFPEFNHITFYALLLALFGFALVVWTTSQAEGFSFRWKKQIKDK